MKGELELSLSEEELKHVIALGLREGGYVSSRRLQEIELTDMGFVNED